ncbi:hypothetical protein BaRGS_00009249 [Batillaria attramentaria]|uniref:C-type lectin domain-containing protein n=1 Tax=Batillaria attramentaria TaxID=370345 RepID=A0ABD0LJW8_9CAEN
MVNEPFRFFLLFVLEVSWFVNAARCTNLHFREWHQIKNEKVMTSFSGWTGSLTECGSTCDQRSDCTAFCYSDITSSCYVKGDMTSQQQLTHSSNVRCFGLVQGTCPLWDDYKLVGGRCVKLFTDPLGYVESRERCSADEAHLYHFKTRLEDEQPFLDLLAVYGFPPLPYNKIALWVGADDLQSEGNFVWSDGTPLANSADVWGVGEPNNYYQNEDCVVYWIGSYLLNDFPCTRETLFVCQLDL